MKLKQISMLLLLTLWHGSLLAEGGEYWKRYGAGRPWFRSAQDICDNYLPKSDPPSDPLPRSTYTFSEMELNGYDHVDCYMESCYTYYSMGLGEIVENCDNIRYESGVHGYCPEGTVPNFETRECEPQYQVSAPLTCPLSKEADPVDPITGNLILKETDIPGRNGPAITRLYQSMGQGQLGANLGVNWTHNFEARVQKNTGQMLEHFPLALSRKYDSPELACIYGWRDIQSKAYGGLLKYVPTSYSNGACKLGSGNEIRAYLSLTPHKELEYEVPFRYKEIIRPNGKLYQFGQDLNGLWENVHNLPIELTQDDQLNWILTLEDGAIEVYGPNDKIHRSTTAEGKQTLYTYNNNNQLTQVTHPTGETTNYEYLDGRISQITAPGGSVSYQYDTSGNLSQVTYPDNTSKQYLYEDPDFPNHLTSIIDENGNTSAIWSYDSAGRVIMNERAGGAEHYNFTYSRYSSRKVTDSAGASRTYLAKIVNGKSTYSTVTGDRCDTCSHKDDKQFIYDGNGHIISRTNWNNIKTVYTKDSSGLELSRTEAEGTPEARTITTEWHSDFRKPTRITEPDRITEFTYDTAGRLLNKTVRPAP